MMRRTIEGSARRALLLVACAVVLLGGRPVPSASAQATGLAVEVRSYNLKPGTRDEFHRLVVATLPMLQRHQVDVVAYGPSAHDSTSYTLIRAFRSLQDRAQREEAFYTSREWREGPRDRVLALIECYTTVVLLLDNATVAGIRATMRR